MPENSVDFRHALNFVLEDRAEGYCRLSAAVRPEYLNPIGILHGGLLFTMADSCSGASLLTYGNRCTTLSANIDYMHAGQGCKTLFAEARVIKHGRKISVVECRITDDLNRLLAVTRMNFFDSGEKADYTVEEKYSRESENTV